MNHPQQIGWRDTDEAQDAIDLENAELVIASLKRERDELHNRLHEIAIRLRPLSEAKIAELWQLASVSDSPTILTMTRLVERELGIE